MAFDKPSFAQAAAQIADHRHRRLLRAFRPRQGEGHAAEKRDEFIPSASRVPPVRSAQMPEYQMPPPPLKHLLHPKCREKLRVSGGVAYWVNRQSARITAGRGRRAPSTP